MPEPRVPAIGAGSSVAIYYTHADGSHSASGCWTMPASPTAREPRVAGETIGEDFIERCLDNEISENGGDFVPVVSAEIVDARRILSPWALSQDGRVYVREVFGTSFTTVSIARILVEQARIDIRAEHDASLKGQGFKLL